MAEYKNILVTTFGGTWLILPELIGYTNPNDFDFYQNHSRRAEIFSRAKEQGIEPVDELWVIHTDSEIASKALASFGLWQKQVGCVRPKVKYFCYQGVSEMGHEEECKAMADLIMRVMLHASERVGTGNLYISLVGGRKNMSADIQRASDLFGCHALIHIADSLQRNSLLLTVSPELLLNPPTGDEVNQLNPMIVFGRKNASPVLFVGEKLKASIYPLKNGISQASTSLLDEINSRLEKSNSLLINSYQQRVSKSPQTAFYGLQLIHPQIISNLENSFIGNDAAFVSDELNWLRKLPKAELHCHIGGILSPSEMIEVACELNHEINYTIQLNQKFANWESNVEDAVANNDNDLLLDLMRNSRGRIRSIAGIEEPLGVAAFIRSFKKKPLFLEEIIYNDLLHENSFVAIGINRYEKLGDLQGSGLLKHPKTLAKTCEILKQKCLDDNIIYCELRCSPANYVTSTFPIEQVVETIRRSLTSCSSTIFTLIIIGSRHNNPELLKRHIELARNLAEDVRYKQFFVGFDIAGDETAKSPSELKTDMEDLLRQCIRTTIHAGEGVSARNIWEAAYELNADRIGHGLTLESNSSLLQRFIDRKIAVEMCPSSNNQIIGYRNFAHSVPSMDAIYPLKKYFDKGVRVTINTDNPGISRTSLSNEFLLAAQLTPEGLSRWDILKIIRNGFKSAFIGAENKKELLLKAENQISKILTG